MTEAQIIKELEKELTPKRFIHTMGVAKTAERLAVFYGGDPARARLAGLLHDCARNIKHSDAIAYCAQNSVFLKDICILEPSLIHSSLGAHLAKIRYGVSDEEVLRAICYHTTGHENMSLLTKIIYVADTIEPSRTQSGVESLRTAAFENLDEALLRAIDATVRHIIKKGGILDPDTIAARNFLIAEKKAAHAAKKSDMAQMHV